VADLTPDEIRRIAEETAKAVQKDRERIADEALGWLMWVFAGIGALYFSAWGAWTLGWLRG
jgi:hypothetical protein